jgi:lysozyme
MMRMKYSKQGLQLTERSEGCKLVAYWDDKGKVWTIGYGHTRGVYEGMTCTQQQAEDWLMADIAFCEQDVNLHVTVELTQGEFDGLVDFCFNLGCQSLNGSTLLRYLNAGHRELAAREFERWDMAGGVHMAGLLRRRLAEEAEFNS